MSFQTWKLLPPAVNKKRLPPHFRHSSRVGDLLDTHYQETLLDDIDVVIHAAAWTSLWGNKNKSKKYFLDPSLKLLENAKRKGIKRFVFISTLASASPDHSENPMSHGMKRSYWPHLSNVITIEETLRNLSDNKFTGVNLRLGLFVGSRYALGLLPILVPRLKTHLVPWVSGGKTSLPLIDGRDIGNCASLAATVSDLSDYESFNVLGPEVPKTREVISYLHEKYHIPLPHFSVPFSIAFVFAGFMELLDKLVSWEPLVTRSIIHLLRETSANNNYSKERLGYKPEHHWQSAIDNQMNEMLKQQTKPMSMAIPLHRGNSK